MYYKLEHWVTCCINLVHSRIDVFHTNQWKPQDVIELYNTMKEKTPLI
jgi:hypothetical protein